VRNLKLSKIKKGFTLIEILLVVAIISILLVVVFAALNPAQRLAQTRDARRWNDVNQILTAVHEYIVDNDGACPWDAACADQAAVELGTCTSGNATTTCTASDCLDLSGTLGGTYLGSMPIDPSGDATNTGYELTASSGIVTIAACNDEGTGTTAIQVTR
jgi:prepilin-type N-terminal cleavage/methylation domain-containing protein